MTRQRSTARVGGWPSVPDQVPAQASQAHRRHRPPLAQALERRAARSSAPAPAPARGCEDTSQASRTPPSRASRFARRLRNQRLDCSGRAARRWQHRRIRAPRAPCPSPPRRRRIARWPRRTGAPCAARTSPCAGTPCLARVSCPTVPAPRPRAQSPRRRTPPTARDLVHLVEHVKAVVALLGIGKTSATPAAIPVPHP